jgi:hypothetical protein
LFRFNAMSLFKIFLTTILLVFSALAAGQAVFATTPQVIITTAADACAERYNCSVQPVITNSGAPDGTVITATVTGGPVLNGATATIQNGVATFTNFGFASGGAFLSDYTITFSDGDTSATQSLTYYAAFGSLTVNNSADSGSGGRWVGNTYLTFGDAIAGSVNASTVVSKLANGPVYLIGTTITVSSAINSTSANSVYTIFSTTLNVNAAISTQGGSVYALQQGAYNYNYPIKFASGANVTTNGGNFTVGSMNNWGQEPVRGYGVVKFTSNTVDVGSGNIQIKTVQVQTSANSGAGNAIGVHLSASTLRASGSGNITIASSPISYASRTLTDASGIYVAAGSTVQVENGAINLTATANYSSTTNTATLAGILVRGTSTASALVTATGTGSITMNGAVGNTAVFDGMAYDAGRLTGVAITAYGSVTTASGNISITGSTGTHTVAFPNFTSYQSAYYFGYFGVKIGDSSASAAARAFVTAGGAGNISINGTAGQFAVSNGVLVQGAAITTNTGALSISGNCLDDGTGATSMSQGVVFAGSAQNSAITSTGGGTVTVTGESGNNTANNQYNGISEGIRLGSTTVDSTGGDVIFNGTTNGQGAVTTTVYTGAGSTLYRHNGIAFANVPTFYNQTHPGTNVSVSIGATSNNVTLNGYTGTSPNAAGIATGQLTGTPFGASTSSFDFEINSNYIHGYWGYTQANFIVDTSGSVTIHPVSSDFALPSGSSFDPKVKMSSRVSKFEILAGVSSTTSNLALYQTVAMSDPNFVMRVRGAAVTIYGQETGTIKNLAVEANGNATLNAVLVTNLALQTTGSTKVVTLTPGTRTLLMKPTDVDGVTAIWGVPSKVAIIAGTAPSPNAGVNFASHKVQVLDAYDNAMSAYNTYGDATVDVDGPTVTAALTSANGATLTGASSALDVVSGSTGVRYPSLAIDNAGTYSLTYSGSFRGSSLTSVQSADFFVGGGAPTVTLVYPTVTYAATGTVLPTTATSSSSGAKSFSTTSASTICTINSSTGAITTVSAGTCSVTLTIAAVTGPPSYLAGSSTVDVTISKAAQVAVTMSTLSITYGATATLSAAGGTGNGAFNYSTSTTGCSLAGAVLSSTLDAASTCSVSVYRSGNSQYLDSAATDFTITVAKANQVALTPPSGSTIPFGASLDLTTLTVTGGSGDGQISFSTATSGCSISGATLISSNNAATTCSIAAVKAASTNYNIGASANFTVTVSKINQSAISVVSTSATFGSTLALTASGGDGTGALTWSVVSGNCTIATSTLTPTGAGSCVIKVSKAASTNYNVATSQDTIVTIARANQSALVWNLTSTSAPYLGSIALATSGGSGTGAVVYSASQNSSCSIVGSTLYVSSVGSVCDVTATKVSDSNYNSTDTQTQSFTVSQIAQAALSFTSAQTMTYGQTLSVLAVGGSGSGTISYSVSNAGTTGCSLNGASLSVTAAGTCVVSATRASSTNYLASAAQTHSITVNKASKTVSFSSVVPSTPVVAGTYVVAATSTSGEAVTFSIAAGSCSITGATVTFSGVGNCRVEAASASSAQYLAAPVAAQTIAVGQRNQTLTFSSSVSAVNQKVFGDLAFTAEAISSVSTLNVAYSRGANTTNNACLVSSTGVITIAAVGRCEILANQAGDANTSAASEIAQTFDVIADFANAPTIVSVSASHESITAAFISPSYTGGAPVTGYVMTAVYNGGEIVNTGCSVIAGNQQSCTVIGLSNGTPYTIKIAAINSRGVGAFSALSASRVPATNPAAVGALTVVPDNTTLQLSWLQPISLGGGTFDSYRIFIKTAGTANYPSTYVTVNSIGANGYQFTNLINGQAYDVRVVTVTTANTLALESNTAEAVETPRTVPDAPAAVAILEVDGNIVISWTSPNSDGGAAITAYQATFAGNACVLASPTDTTCLVAAPTVAGNYQINVKAQNPAGLGTAASTTFTRAGLNQQMVDPNQMQVLGFNIRTLNQAGGQLLILKTKNMQDITEVLVDGKGVKIVSISATEMQVLMPAHKDGVVAMTFIGPKGKLVFENAVTYQGGKAALLVTTIKNYIEGNSVLSKSTKLKLNNLTKQYPKTVSATCVGYQSNSYNRMIDAKVAKQRALNACNYLKSKNPKLITKILVARTPLVGVASRKLEIRLSYIGN